MADEPTKTTVENIPSVTGSISGIASANAPFIYFEDAPFFGLLNGVGKIRFVFPPNSKRPRKKRSIRSSFGCSPSREYSSNPCA
jgi:hypothetical protein